ncbi:MAG TPA: hypothetical protein VGC63_13100 [Solirubrobacterales bacterium]
MGALVIAVCLVAGVTAIGSASAVSRSGEHHCKVGGPPAWRYLHVVRPVKRLSSVVTIACGNRLAGPFEIVALDTSEGLFIYADGPSFSEGAVIRDPQLMDFPEPVVTVSSGWGGPPARSRAYGVLAANVASVEVIFHHRGEHRRVSRTPTTAYVTGAILAELHQTEPFGAYAMTLPGCVPPKGIRVVAFDAQGRRVGTARGLHLLPYPCNPNFP